MNKGAVISDCKQYRYQLTRLWDTRPPICFIMLNPSIADALQDDPTIKECIGWGVRWGHGGMVAINLFAYRSTSPKLLPKVTDPVGPDNDHWYLHTMCNLTPSRYVAAWGTGGHLNDRARQVAAWFNKRALDLHCLGTTKDGSPRHPLYMPHSAPLVRWAGYPVTTTKGAS